MMNNYNWCHGTECHTYETQDRLRGVKGNKVLRTRKIKVQVIGIVQHHLGIGFVVINCQQDFWNKYGSQIRAIAPRNEPLETPVDVIIDLQKQKSNQYKHRCDNLKYRLI
jgi:hypothetical protein